MVGLNNSGASSTTDYEALYKVYKDRPIYFTYLENIQVFAPILYMICSELALAGGIMLGWTFLEWKRLD